MKIALFDQETLEKNLKELGPVLLKLLTESAEKFVKDNQADALEIGEENAKAILEAHFYAAIEIPELTEDMTMEELALFESILKKRDAATAFIAAAQASNNLAQQRVAKAAAKVGTSIGLTVLGLTLKALIGG